jgi:hypothetical protein
MTKTELFELIKIASFCIPTVITMGLLFLLPKSWPFKFKTLLSVIVAWITSVLFTIYIYNPAGFEMGLEQGIDSPKMHFDNNTSGASILTGWIVPLVTCFIFYLGKIAALIYKVRKCKQ